MSTRKDRHRRQRGFTFVEVAITSFIVLMTLGAATRLMGTTSELSRESHAHTRAHAEHRRNLIQIGNILRTASGFTLAGFDEAGVATTPSFQRVFGVDRRDHLYTDVERIEWRPLGRQVSGVANPGQLWLLDPSGEELVADRVPMDGFEVRREGNLLAIRLTTYYAVTADHVAQVTSETAVSLRN